MAPTLGPPLIYILGGLIYILGGPNLYIGGGLIYILGGG